MSQKSKGNVKVKIKTNFWDKWTVEFINSQQWSFEETKKKKSPKKGATPTPTVPTINYFCDNEIVILPKEYQSRIAGWKRPIELFFSVDVTEIEYYVSLFQVPLSVDVFQMNSHLNDSRYYSHIMNAIEGLFLYPRWNSTNFEDFGFAKWEPQNHIYSVSKIISGTPHYPEFNKYGKYIVRLYHCGKWRAIIVDDRIPVDKDNNILIPCLKYESKIYLWLHILVKAILKLNEYRKEDKEYYMAVGEAIAKCDEEKSICCYCDRKNTAEKTISDNERKLFEKLNVVTVLTGWNPVKTTFFDNNEEEIWNYLYDLVEVFKYPKKPKKGEIIIEKEYPLIMMQLDFQNSNNFELCLLTARNISIQPKPMPPELTPWKKYRWLDWAIKHGFYNVDPPDLYHSLAFTIVQSRIELIREYFEPDWYEMQLKASSPKGKKDSSKGNKSSKTKSLPSPQTASMASSYPAIIKLPIWLKFNLIKENIKTLIVFNQNKLYKYNIFITNELAEVVGKKPDKSGKKSAKSVKTQDVQIIDENAPVVQEFICNKNNYVYIFIDNLQDILAVITLTNMKMHGTEYGFIVCEALYWESNQRMKFFEIKLLNQSCERIIFPRGRHIYRLEIQLNNYNIHIQTNGLIKICNDYELFKLMSDRPLRFIDYFTKLSEKFKLLIDNIGADDYNTFMQQFFHQILYNFNTTKLPAIKNHTIYELFLINFIQLNKNLLQKLFLYKNWMKNNNFDFCYNKKVCLNMMMIYNHINRKEYLCECDKVASREQSSCSEDAIYTMCTIDINKSKYFDKYFNFIVNNYAATMIQTIFKMYFIQLLIKNYHKMPIDSVSAVTTAKGDKTSKKGKSGKGDKTSKMNKTSKDDKTVRDDKTITDDMKSVKPDKTGKTNKGNTTAKLAAIQDMNKFELNKFMLDTDFYEINFLQNPEIIYKFLLENFFNRILPNDIKLLNYYDFENDLDKHYVNLYEINGIIKALSISKISLLLQGCFKCHSIDGEKQFYFIKFAFLDLKITNIIYFVRIIDNDTNKEIFINKNNLIQLSSNGNGYTMFIYYFVAPPQLQVQTGQTKASLFPMNVKWRLYIVSQYNVNNLHLCALCKFIKHTMLSCICEQETEDLDPSVWINCDKKDEKMFINYINYMMYWPNNEKRILFYTLLLGDDYMLTLFFNMSNLDINFCIKIWVKATDEVIYNGVHKGFVSILSLFLFNEMKEPVVEIVPEVSIPKSGKGKTSGKSSKGTAKTQKGASNKAALLQKLELERYTKWIENPVFFTEYCLQIELRDEWELTDDEQKNIYNSQHEIITELIQIEEDEALENEENVEEEEKIEDISKSPFVRVITETTTFKYPCISAQDHIVEKPFWNLQINYPQTSLIIVQPDLTNENNIIQIKKKWQKTGILDMGEFVRNEFVYSQQKLYENGIDPCNCINSRSREIFVTNYPYESSSENFADEAKSINIFEGELEEQSEFNLLNILSPTPDPFCTICDRLTNIIMAKVYARSLL